MPQVISDVKDDADLPSCPTVHSVCPLLLSAVLNSKTKSSRRNGVPCPMPGHSCVTLNEYLESCLDNQTG